MKRQRMSLHNAWWIVVVVLTPALAPGVEARQGPAGDRALPPQAAAADTLALDPGEALYRAARRHLARGSYQEAVRALQELRERHPESQYVADSYFYEAMALLRMELPEGAFLREAPMSVARTTWEAQFDTLRLEVPMGDRTATAQFLLRRQLEEHQDARTAQEARALERRLLEAELRQAQAAASGPRAGTGTLDCPPERIRTREAALTSLLRTDPDGVGELLEELAGDDDPCAALLRRTAVMGLARRPGGVRVGLLTELAVGDPDLEVRRAAVMALGWHTDPEARDALWRLLESASADPSTRSTALHFLAQEPTTQELARLRSVYEGADSDELRFQIAVTVAQKGGAAAREWLLGLARDPSTDEEIRRMVIFTGDWSGGVDDLVALFDDMDAADPIRRQVIYGLSRIPEAEATQALIGIVRALPEGELRQQAVFSLGQRDDPAVRELLRELVRGGPGE